MDPRHHPRHHHYKPSKSRKINIQPPRSTIVPNSHQPPLSSANYPALPVRAKRSIPTIPKVAPTTPPPRANHTTCTRMPLLASYSILGLNLSVVPREDANTGHTQQTTAVKPSQLLRIRRNHSNTGRGWFCPTSAPLAGGWIASLVRGGAGGLWRAIGMAAEGLGWSLMSLAMGVDLGMQRVSGPISNRQLHSRQWVCTQSASSTKQWGLMTFEWTYI